MSAPTATSPSAAVGWKMEDGYQARYVFGNKPTIALWEIGVKPFTLEGGEPIEVTTQQNTKWRTMAHRHLMTLGPSTVTAAFDPDVFNDLIAQINEDQVFTTWFPDGSALAFWGFLQKVEFPEMKEGTFPELTLTIVPTNRDLSHVEQSPVLVPASGT